MGRRSLFTIFGGAADNSTETAAGTNSSNRGCSNLSVGPRRGSRLLSLSVSCAAAAIAVAAVVDAAAAAGGRVVVKTKGISE